MWCVFGDVDQDESQDASIQGTLFLRHETLRRESERERESEYEESETPGLINKGKYREGEIPGYMVWGKGGGGRNTGKEKEK